MDGTVPGLVASSGMACAASADKTVDRRRARLARVTGMVIAILVNTLGLGELAETMESVDERNCDHSDTRAV